MATTKKTQVKTKEKSEHGLALLALICWIVPLAGFAFDIHNWITWLVWLVIGTVILARYVEKHPE